MTYINPLTTIDIKRNSDLAPIFGEEFFYEKPGVGQIGPQSVMRKIEAPSRKAAELAAKEMAASNGWRYLNVQEEAQCLTS